MTLFRHDCPDCVYLGTYTFQPRRPAVIKTVDLHFCPACDGGTVIARYGPDGRYSSSPISMIGTMGTYGPALAEALRRIL